MTSLSRCDPFAGVTPPRKATRSGSLSPCLPPVPDPEGSFQTPEYTFPSVQSLPSSSTIRRILYLPSGIPGTWNTA